MYELKYLKGNTYYIEGPTNIGVYKLNEKDCAIIDSGNSNEGEIIYNILINNGLDLKYIINTHCHVDHTGSNTYLQEKTNCMIITSKIEAAYMAENEIDISAIYGGYCLNEFRKYSLNTQTNKIYLLDKLPKGLETFDLPGHHHGMIGIKTDDDVYFIADSLCGVDMVEKDHILYVYDVKAYLKSIKKVRTLNGNIIVPSHSVPTTNINELADINENKVNEIIDLILNALNNELTLEDIVAIIYKYYEFKPSYNRYFLCMAVIRSYLAYLANEGMIQKELKNYKLYYKKITNN